MGRCTCASDPLARGARRWERHAAARDLWVWQPRPGYRFSCDPVLLAGWVLEQGVPQTVLDVGTGSGILGLLLARAGARVVGIDALELWAPWARRSAAESGLSDRYRFEVADARAWDGPEVELVVANPPYFPAGSGAQPADPLRAAARHALRGDLDELVPAMARRAARVALVLPAARAVEAQRHLAACGRPVVRSLKLAPRLVLVEGRRTGGPAHHEEAALRLNGHHHPRVHALYTSAGAPLSRTGVRRGRPNTIGTRDGSSPAEDGRAPVDVARTDRPSGSEAPASWR